MKGGEGLGKDKQKASGRDYKISFCTGESGKKNTETEDFLFSNTEREREREREREI